MAEALERLVDSLLYEGYALYPYTPGAAKNATPTPFGIVYPPGYAQTLASAFDYLELRCLLRAPSDAVLAAEVRLLASSGERHEAHEHRLALAPLTLAELAGASRAREYELAGAAGPLRVALSLAIRPRGQGTWELALRVENRSECPAACDRACALRGALLSTHPQLSVSQGSFVSALESGAVSVNTFPVLAGERGEAIVGATIMLPDHPEIAPESLGGLFDSTEIEEALLLHVLALSDSERREIERQDPAVREMLARASAVTPAELLALHGRVRIRDRRAAAEASGESAGAGDTAGGGRDARREGGESRRPRAGAVTDSPPREPPGLADPSAGEREVELDGVRFHRGAHVRICPGPEADLHARMLAGRTARIERILVDYEGKVHLGVTVDGDPGQELMSETGRFLFFFAPEVELIS